MDPSVKIEMPALLDCLRKDIYALVSKLQLPQEQQVQIGQLIEQIRLEENKYQEDIKKLFQTNNATYESNLNMLKQKCSKLEEKVKECESKEIRRAAEHELDDYVNERLKKSVTTSLHHDEVQEISTVIQSMRKIHDDLVNLSMETRLSLEFEKKENDAMFSQVTSSLTTIVEKYQQLNTLYVKECERRRKIFNELQDLKGTIRVFCRIRPMIDQEISNHESIAIEAIDETSLQIQLIQNSVNSGKGQRRNDKIYEFDRVFDEHSTQAEVFEEVKGLVTSVLDGYCACILAYGQTGSGKTYTMEGEENVENEGVIPRTLQALYSSMHQQTQSSYSVTINMFEIYNEKLFDLLAENKPIEARLDPDGHVLFPTAICVSVHELAEMQEVLKKGKEARRIASTSSNQHSSRSHMLFILSITSVNPSTHQQTQGRLVLVDLAGSERVSKTESTGQRLIEGQYINKSLSSLGDVIHALNNKHKHIPFRNSMLTFILQDVLAEGNKVLVITQLSPAFSNTQESLQSLEFANRVNKIALGKGVENKNHAMVAKLNDMNDKLKYENASLKEELKSYSEKSSFTSESMQQLEKRVQTLTTLLSDKNLEISHLKSKVEELEAEIAGKSRLLQDRTNEVKDLKSRVTQLQQEQSANQNSSIASSHVQSDIPRDSFGSFVDTSSSHFTRRLSTIGLSVPSTVTRSTRSSSIPSLTTTQPSIVNDERKSIKRTSLAPSKPIPSTATSTMTDKPPQRRISLIERSRMLSKSNTNAAVPPSSSTIVSGTARFSTVSRKKPVLTRKSLVPVKAEEARKEPVPSTQQQEKQTSDSSMMKRGKFTSPPVDSTPSANRPVYTYTPSSERRATLDGLLFKSNKGMNQEEKETTTFITATSYRKQENPNSFLSSGSSNSSLLGSRNSQL